MEFLEISLSDPIYPELLKQIFDPPERLWVWGNPEILNNPAIAIVGSRKPSDYGVRAAGWLARGLSPHAYIISGLAYGVDTVALTEAADPGKAIAVIGSGLDRDSFYPASNWQLAQRIVEHGGAIISEYPIGTPPLKHHFPARNRIIAGLALGVVAVEAGEKSGALITTDLALQFNRDVFAIAGSVFAPQAVGTNKLIKDGAQIITQVSDVLTSLGISAADLPIQPRLDLSTVEQTIINILATQAEGLSVNELTSRVQLDTQKVSSTLTMMEIKGVVKNLGAGKFTCLVS
ncbi:MAG: DNA-processing protein DprA [Patescibacteria group bacterium]